MTWGSRHGTRVLTYPHIDVLALDQAGDVRELVNAPWRNGVWGGPAGLVGAGKTTGRGEMVKTW